MVISSFISSVLILALGIWAYMRLEPTMNIVAEKQLLIEPSKFSYKMWKDMPVTMYQSFTFFNLTNWQQVKSIGQKPRFVEVGPYIYRTTWSKSDISFSDEDRLINFAEKKQWIFQPHLSKGFEEDQIWTINTPLMTALALIQNAPVITRNIVSVILDGLGEGAFIKRNIKSLLFDGYSDLIVSVGPLFDRRFANFNGKFAYLYNKNDSIDGHWQVSTGVDDINLLNKIHKFHSNIVNMTSQASGQMPQGLNEVKPECAAAWSLDAATNGQLFAPINRDPGKFIFYPDLCRPIHLLASKQQVLSTNGIKAQRYFIDPRVFMNSTQVPSNKCYEMNPKPPLANALAATINSVTGANVAMPNLVVGGSSPFAMFASQQNHNSPSSHHHHHHRNEGLFERSNHPASFLNNALHSLTATVAAANPAHQDQSMSASNTPPSSPASPIAGRLGRVRQLFNNIVSQRMSVTNPSSLLPSLSSGPAGMLMGNHHHHHHHLLNPFSKANARNSLDDLPAARSNLPPNGHLLQDSLGLGSNLQAADSSNQAIHPKSGPALPPPVNADHQSNNILSQKLALPSPLAGASDRWITQFRFKWPRGVFSIGQCQLGAPIYASLPHFLDADEYYLEQVDGLKPNRSLHEFYIDVESNLHSIPVNLKGRLQLNVATPELRFRNIPNAMIPVLWQEVTFSINKPIATMLYWSFTMSPTIYKSISIILIVVGVVTMILSFIGGFRQRRRKNRGASSSSSSASLSSSSASCAASISGEPSINDSISTGLSIGATSSGVPATSCRNLIHPNR